MSIQIENPPGSGGTSGPVAAADITDAGTAGIAVLQAETQAQLRTAAGFGGTVTVAELTAAGDAAKSAMWYCSNCLTTNGPGSIVAWCSRTSSWRTIDECLLATTDFGDWVCDFLGNSAACELRGTKGALVCAAAVDNSLNLASAVGVGAVTSVGADTTLGAIMRKAATGSTTATGYVREYATPITRYAADFKPSVFVGVRQQQLSTVAPGYFLRIGFTGGTTTSGLTANEDSLCYDPGNVLGGLNPGNVSEWLGCIRSSSVNLAGSGPLGVAPSANVPHNVCVVRVADAVDFRIDGASVGGGTGGGGNSTLTPLCVLANDGTSTAGVISRKLAFCYGYLLP